MAYDRTAPRTTYRVRRARPRALVVALAAVLVAVGAWAASGLFAGGAASSRSGDGSGGLSASGRWPAQGQAAVVFGGGRPAASPDQAPEPIASLAKVMTAYLTLERYPLEGAGEGFTIAVTAAEARAVEEEADEGQSVVAVRAGERLSERQLLEALLIPSGNNIARMLAARLAGSEGRFLAEMNEAAAALGMDATTYTDPSGFDPGTVSTAADQLRLFRRAMGFAAFRRIVSTAAVTLPVAGTVTNFDPLLGAGYPGKTGSDSAAGGCLAFFTHVTHGGRPVTAVGVVMGQGEGSDTAALLDAAGEAATRLVGGAASASVTMRPPPRSAPSP
jgi:serine-type D-Ala-D-Ala carboxypeptidase (penicillin-binding protein 5/6)